MSGASFSLFYLYVLNSLDVCDADVNIFIFVASTRPRSKRRYHARVEKVREYLETVKDFDELISPRSLFGISLDHNHLSTPKGTLRSSRRVSLLNHRLGKLNMLVIISLHLFIYLFIFFLFFFLGMTTRFNKAKLVEIQEKKAKTGLTDGLLTRKCQRDAEPPKDNPMVTSPIATSIP